MMVRMMMLGKLIMLLFDGELQMERKEMVERKKRHLEGRRQLHLRVRLRA